MKYSLRSLKKNCNKLRRNRLQGVLCYQGTTIAMRKFAQNIVYPHHSDRSLFYSTDSVNLLKRIRNNWLNSKPDQIFCYLEAKYDSHF